MNCCLKDVKPFLVAIDTYIIVMQLLKKKSKFEILTPQTKRTHRIVLTGRGQTTAVKCPLHHYLVTIDYWLLSAAFRERITQIYEMDVRWGWKLEADL